MLTCVKSACLLLYCVVPLYLAKPSDNLKVFQKDTYITHILQHFNMEVFLHRTTTLSIAIKTQTNEAKYFFNDIIDELLQPLSELKIKIANSVEFKDYEYYNLLLVDSFDAFRQIDVGPRTMKQDFSEFYLIVLYTEDHKWLQEIQNIFDYCWSYYIVNVDILVHKRMRNTNSSTLYTYYPFSPEYCNKALPQQLSSGMTYHNLTFTDFYPMKFSNFFSCTLVAALWNVPPYLILPKTKTNPLNFGGVEGYLLGVLAGFMNFQIDYLIPPNDEQRGLIMKNGSVTGAIKLLQQKQADLSLGSFRCALDRSTVLSPTRSYYQTMQVFTVLAELESWTTFEILTYPFQFWVWVTLGIILLSLMLTTVLLHHFQPAILKFLFGFSNVQIIIFNFISFTLGQPVHELPQRNFARYVYCMWLYLMLILRSAYQGLLYDYMNSDITVAPPDTALQLTQRGYHLIVNTATADAFSEVPIIRDKQLKVLIMNITDTGGFSILEEQNTKRLVTGTPLDFLTHFVITHKKYGIFHVVREAIFSQQLCIYFTKHSYLTVHFDEVLLNLRSFGLIDYWASLFIDYSALERETDRTKEETMRPLAMMDLYGAFQIQYCLCMLAGVVFLGELLWSRWSKKISRLGLKMKKKENTENVLNMNVPKTGEEATAQKYIND